MKLVTAISRAMDAVRSSDTIEATRLIQKALRGEGCHNTSPPSPALDTLKLPGRDAEKPRFDRKDRRAGLGETLAALSSLKRRFQDSGHGPDSRLPETPYFQKRSFACAVGQRDFRLFIPGTAKPAGLLVMMHGCRQTAEDFALGTNMNAIAEDCNLLVAYPHQPASENPMSCWNWFRPQDQARLGGEAEIIARLTESVMAEFALPQGRAYVAGLSAGGAMAAVLGSTYPELYSAVGIHSGLAYRSAHDVNSAFAAMRGQARSRGEGPARQEFEPRLIVFHGSSDQTVVPENASRLWDEAVRSKGSGDIVQATVSIGGRAVDRRTFTEAGIGSSVEEWIIHGSGHAWSGGNPIASYTDAGGPNASKEMVRFFLGGP